MSATQTSYESGRNLALDGVRGLAAFSVLFSHFSPQNSIWWAFQYGKIGVIVFFILSGYLIVSILLNGRNNIESGTPLREIWKGFYLRRALRIFPLYYGVIIFFCLIGYQNIIDNFWWHATFTSNLGSSLFSVNFDNLSHFWSICIEEQFYLVIPAVVLCLPKDKSFKILCTAFLASMAFKLYAAGIPNNSAFLARLPISNAEGISYGALIAYAAHSRTAKNILSFVTKWITPVAVVLFLAMSTYRFFVRVPAYETYMNIALMDLFIAISFGHIIAMLVKKPASGCLGKILSTRLLVYMGTVSYGTYIYHYALFPYYAKWFQMLSIERGTTAAVVFMFATSYFLATVSWFALEKPILSLKKYISAKKPHRLSPRTS